MILSEIRSRAELSCALPLFLALRTNEIPRTDPFGTGRLCVCSSWILGRANRTSAQTEWSPPRSAPAASITSIGRDRTCGAVRLDRRHEDHEAQRSDSEREQAQNFSHSGSYAFSNSRREGASADRSACNSGAVGFSRLSSVASSGSLIRNHAT